MTAASLHRLRGAERAALVIAIVAALSAAVFGWFNPHTLVPAWRLAAFACLQPAIGSLIFILIHRLTGGQWGRGLAPFLLSGARLLPWIWVLILPLLWFPVAAEPRALPANVPRDERTETEQRDLAQWRDSTRRAPGTNLTGTTQPSTAIEHVFASGGSRSMGRPLHVYFSHPFLIGRAVIYGLAFFFLAGVAPRAMRATTTFRWYGPVGLLSLVFLLHLLATDWLVLLDPGWYSTGFPLVWMAAQAIAGLALAIAAGVSFGAETSRTGEAGHVRGLDWGNLLLASILVWSYVAFVQLLIIWSGNLPAETAWYRHRQFGAWGWLSLAVAALVFGAPFPLLLSRKVKKRRTGLALVAALLLLGELGYTIWLIAPAFPLTTFHAPWAALALCVAALALFLNRYLAGARTAAARLLA